jgi:hypothetical protein
MRASRDGEGLKSRARICVWVRDGVERPFAESLQLADAAWLEADTGTRHEIFDGAGHEHLAFIGLCGDPRADVDGETGELFIDDVALTGVDTDADAESDARDRVTDRAAAANSAGGAVEAGGEEAVAGGIDRLAAEAG